MYDLIIIGAGSAGLAASIYASRYKINHLVLGKIPGGLTLEAHMIENYPGIMSISGMEIMQKFQEHAQSLGVKIEQVEVTNIEKKNKEFEITNSENRKYQTKTIILALGTKRRKLNIPGEKEFLGKGVSYCAVCDCMFYKDKVVAVIGGSDAAAMAALLLAEHTKKVYIIYRKEKLRAEPIVVEKVEADPKIKIIYNTNVLEVKGKDKLEKIILDKLYKGSAELKLDGIFVEIGSVPVVALARKIGVEVDEQNYIKIDSSGSTNIPGVFAAGDITAGLAKLRQIVTAAAEGAVAATSVYEYLKTKEYKN